jgi:signal transduction histidine kinase
MRRSISPRLASRLLLAQILVVAVGAITPVIAAAFLAPRLFHLHLMQAGVTNSEVTVHAEAAFQSAMGIAVMLGVVMSLVAAGIVSWFLVRRIAAPIEQLAKATHDVAAGLYAVDIPTNSFSIELDDLASSFEGMAQRLAEAGAARTRMLADLAHEVRTPLATLQAYVDGLEDGVIDTDPAAWDTMRHQIARLRRLADDIRAVAQAEEQQIELEPMDGCDAVHAAVLAAIPRYQSKGVALDLQACAGPCSIKGDAIRLQQVFANLLDNALRHTPVAGSVTVACAEQGRRYVVTVADTGDGIPGDRLETIFERLHRVDSSRANSDGSGSGLGLTIARAIVRAHGGTITASSEGLGRGAAFTVVLPLAEQ